MLDTQAARVLVIDDNSSVRSSLRKILEGGPVRHDALIELEQSLLDETGPAPRAPPGFSVHLAEGGEEGCTSAWRALGESRPFSMAFVDMRMPGGWDGLTTIEELWKVDPDIQVVICTAYADHSWEDFVARLGRTDRFMILRKPFETIEVVQLATALCEKWGLQRAQQTRLDDLESRIEERTRELNTANAELRRSELSYRKLFESNPLPMWVYDLETLRFLAVNDVACLLYGYTRDEFLAMGLREIRPAADIARLEESVRVTGANTINSGLWRHRKKDGSLIDVEIFSHETVHEGRASRFVCPLDVTERLRAETALREAEARFRALVEQSIAGIYIVEDGRVTYANPKLCEILGYTRDELAGIDIPTLAVGEDRQKIVEAFRDRKEGNRGSMLLDCQLRAKDGGIVHLSVESKVIRIGQADVAVGVVRDVSPRVKALEALKESEQRFRELAENINEVFFLADPANNRDLYVSPAFEQVWGQTCASLYADPSIWDRSIHPDDRDLVRRSVDERRRTGDFECEYRIMRPDGAVRWIRSRGSAIRDESGAIYRIAGVAEDITERKAIEDEVHCLAANLERRVAERTAALAAANQELEAFDYSISHDLRAPLRHITEFSAALIEDYADKLDGKGNDYLARLNRAGSKLDQMVSDLLGLSTLTRGEAYRGDVDMSGLADSVVAELRRRDPGRAVEVSVQRGMRADADRGLVHIALENLLGNAWKFTAPCAHARIEVGCIEKGGKQIFFVRDNGAGFEMAYADKLFAPFRRLHKESEFKGTGIGLATVQRVVRRHSGRVWAESTVGEGAKFSFTLSA